jgi:hypothetical protein
LKVAYTPVVSPYRHPDFTTEQHASGGDHRPSDFRVHGIIVCNHPRILAPNHPKSGSNFAVAPSVDQRWCLAIVGTAIRTEDSVTYALGEGKRVLTPLLVATPVLMPIR